MSNRAGILPWSVGVFCVASGALALVLPRQFDAPAFAALRPGLAWWGGSMVVLGGSLLAAASRPSPGRLLPVALVATCAELMLVAGGMAAAGAWTGAAMPAGLSLGLAAAALTPGRFTGSPPWHVRLDGFSLATGATAIVVGVGLLWTPPPVVEPAPWIWAALVGGGLALVAAEVVGNRWRLAAPAASSFLAVVFWACLVLVVVPSRNWTAAVYYVEFGTVLALRPWIGPYLARVDIGSLRAQLALAMAAVTAVSLLGASLLDADKEEQLLVDQALGRDAVVAAAMARDVAQHVQLYRSGLEVVASQPGFADLAPDARDQVLRTLRTTYPDASAYLVLDAGGTVLARTDDVPVSSGALSGLYLDVRGTASPAVRVVPADPAGADPSLPLVALGAPVLRGDGSLAGLVVGVLDASRLGRVIGDTNPAVPVSAFVLGSDGQVIAPPGRQPGPWLEDFDSVRQNATAGANQSTAFRYDEAGDDRFVGYARVPGLPWGVAVEEPATLALASVEAGRDLSFRIMLYTVLAAAAAGALGAGPLSSPLRTLASAARRLAAGDGAAPLPRSTISEVAQLAAAFAEMRDDLAAHAAERGRAEEALRERNHVLETLISASPLCVVVLSPDGIVRRWNPAAEQLFGWNQAETIGRYLPGVPENRLEAVRQRIDAVSRGARIDGFETQRHTREGEPIDVAIWMTSLRDATGGVDGILLIIADIRERQRHQAERLELAREQVARIEAEAAQRRLGLLAEASALLSASLDLKATLQNVARVAVPRFADWCMVDLVEGGVVQGVACVHADPAKEPLLYEIRRNYPVTLDGPAPASQALRSEKAIVFAPFSEESLASTARNAEQLQLLKALAPVSAIATPLIARQRTVGVITFVSSRPARVYDPTDLALAEALARRCALAIDNARLYQAAHEAIQARDTFLSIASHELSAPVARMRAYAEVLHLARSHEQLDDALLERSIRSIESASGRLATLTRDLLDVSRLRSGEMPLRLTRVDLAALARGVAERYVDLIGDRHQLVVDVADGCYPAMVDPARVEQVLENLLDNALKYSPKGGEIRLTLREDGGGMLLQIQDHGIGLPADGIDGLFQPFGRAANAEQKGIPGMGLGLYICRTVLQRQGGRLWIESPGEDRGTTVSMWLPASEELRTTEPTDDHDSSTTVVQQERSLQGV